MSDDPVPAVEIVKEHGSFLLIRVGCRFAVVERRAGQIYPMIARWTEWGTDHPRRDGAYPPSYRATIRDEGHRDHAEWAGRCIG